MTGQPFTEADVDAAGAAHAWMHGYSNPRDGDRKIAADILATVVPAMRDRIELDLLRYLKRPDAESIDYLIRVRSKRSGGDHAARCEYPGPENDCPRHGERCPDCGMRGLHAADHYGWPDEGGDQ